MEATTPDNRRITGAQLIIEGEYLVFSDYSEDHANSIDRDLDIEIAELMALTRRGKTFVESGICGYARLRDLPRLRALHATLKLCLLYTSPSPRDRQKARMPSSA